MQVAGEIRLWRAVVSQALIDSINKVTGKVRAGGKLTVQDQVTARYWLTKRSKDFTEVCDLAQLSPEYVYEKVATELKKRNIK